MTAPFTAADASRSHHQVPAHPAAGPGQGAPTLAPTLAPATVQTHLPGASVASPVADTTVADTLVASTAAGGSPVAGTATTGTTVDHLTETYQAHYSSLLRLAALLLDDAASCEDVVQEAFIRVHSARRRLRDPDKTLAYLRQTVVNLSRSTLRRRIMGLRLLPKPMPDAASAEEGAYDALERGELMHALRGLQRRQREVLVLRYFSDMTEAQVADTLGISVGSVKAYGSRGLAALRISMDGDVPGAPAEVGTEAPGRTAGTPKPTMRTARPATGTTTGTWQRTEGRQR